MKLLTLGFVGGLVLGSYWQYEAGELKLLRQLKAHDSDLMYAENVINEISANLERQTRENEHLYLKLKTEQQRKNKVIKEQVIKYVQSPDAGTCKLPSDWVRIHDQAATGEDNSADTAASGVDDTAARVTDADALPVIVDNYEVCRGARLQLIGLQEWAKAVSGG